MVEPATALQLDPSQIEELGGGLLAALQIAILVFGIAWAFLGVYIHKFLISVSVFLLGVLVGLSIGGPFLAEVVNIRNELAIWAFAVVIGGFMVSLVWFIIRVAVLITGGAVAYALGTLLFGSPTLSPGGLLMTSVLLLLYLALVLIVPPVIGLVFAGNFAELTGRDTLRARVLNLLDHNPFFGAGEQHTDAASEFGAFLDDASNFRLTLNLVVGTPLFLFVLVMILLGVPYFVVIEMGVGNDALRGFFQVSNIGVATMAFLGMALAWTAYRLIVAVITALTGATMIAGLVVIRDFLRRVVTVDLRGVVELITNVSELGLAMFGLVFVTGVGTQAYLIYADES